MKTQVLFNIIKYIIENIVKQVLRELFTNFKENYFIKLVIYIYSPYNIIILVVLFKGERMLINVREY